MRPIKQGPQNTEIIISRGHDIPDGVEGGKALLDGIWSARGLPLGISDAHRDQEAVVQRQETFQRWKRRGVGDLGWKWAGQEMMKTNERA